MTSTATSRPAASTSGRSPGVTAAGAGRRADVEGARYLARFRLPFRRRRGPQPAQAPRAPHPPHRHPVPAGRRGGDGLQRLLGARAASSGGDGTASRSRYVGYGAVGLRGLCRCSRARRWRPVRKLTPACCSSRPSSPVAGDAGARASGSRSTAARRWVGAGPLRVPALRAPEARAGALRRAALLAAKPQLACARHARARCCWSRGRRAAGGDAARPRHGAGDRLRDHDAAGGRRDAVCGRSATARSAVAALLVALFAMLEPYRRARLTAFIDPWARRQRRPASSRSRARSRSARAACFGVGLGQSSRRSSTCPRRTRTSSSRCWARSSGVVGILGLLILYGMVAYAGLRTAKAAAGRLREAAGGRASPR